MADAGVLPEILQFLPNCLAIAFFTCQKEGCEKMHLTGFHTGMTYKVINAEISSENLGG